VLLSATNSTGKAKQILQIIVQRRAGINGNHKLSAAVGHHFKFMVVPYGYPAPTIKESGRLPAGVKFTRQTNHKAVLSGTPEAGTAGTYHIRITVANSLGKTTMNYTLSIAE